METINEILVDIVTPKGYCFGFFYEWMNNKPRKFLLYYNYCIIYYIVLQFFATKLSYILLS